MARLPATNITPTPPPPEMPSPEAPLPEAPAVPPRSARRDAERAARFMAGLDWALLAVAVALGVMLASFPVRNSDFWQHIATGRYIAQGRTDVLFGADPFSFATEGRHWANHAWLYDLLIYALYCANPTGAAVVIFKAVIVALLAGVMLLACRPAPAERIAPGSKANPTAWFAALLTGIALVALSPRLFLQPTVLSMLFLAATFWLLNRESDETRPVKFVAPVAALFVLWVNCDAWFILGPALVLLFLLGEVVQRFFPGAGSAGSLARMKTLALALGVGLLACLVNPHHIYAFTLPADLDEWKLAPGMRREGFFSFQFISPFRVKEFWGDQQYGGALATYCYAALLVLGLDSFVLNVSHLRWSHVLSWLALAALSLYTARAIPFFSAVAVPVTVLNLNAWFARRPEWTDEPAAGPAEPKAAGSITVTPAKLAAFGGLAGRLLTLVAGIVALLASYPGWLSGPTAPDHRVGWSVQPDPGLKEAAEKLQALHESGQMPPDAQGFHFRPEISNYCAWFAPAEKGFFDLRYPLLGDLSNDFLHLRRGLRDLATTGEAGDDWEGVLQARHITHFVLMNAPREDANDILRLCCNDDNRRFVLWFQNGKTATFGWHDRERPSTSDPLRFDFGRAAFGPAAERMPAPKLVPLPAEADRPQDLMERYLSPPRAPRPAETMAALSFNSLRPVTARRSADRANLVLYLASLAAPFGQPRIFVSETTRTDLFRLTAEKMINQDEETAALSLLAVRAARHGIAAAPDQALPYLTLAQLYTFFPSVGNELRDWQLLGLLHQGVARVTRNEKESELGSVITAAHLQLYTMHALRQQIDLATEHLEQAIKLWPDPEKLDKPQLAVVLQDFEQALKVQTPPRSPVDERFRELRAYCDKQLAHLKDNVLSRQREQFELRSTKLPDPQKAFFALNLGLYREGLKILEANMELDTPAMLMLASTYLAFGRLDDAQRALDVLARDQDLEAPEHRRLLQQYRFTQTNLAIAAGDYARAAKELDALFVDLQQQLSDPVSKVALAQTIDMVVFGDLLGASPFSRIGPLAVAITVPIDQYLLNGPLYHTQRVASQITDWHARRGMLALEEGDTTTALAHLMEAVEPQLGPALDFAGRPYAVVYLHFLKKENPELARALQQKRQAANRAMTNSHQ